MKTFFNLPRRNSPQWAKASSLSRIHDHTRIDTLQSVGLLWTSDKPDAETSNWKHTTFTTDRHPCLGCDSNPQSQQANDRRPMKTLEN